MSSPGLQQLSSATAQVYNSSGLTVIPEHLSLGYVHCTIMEFLHGCSDVQLHLFLILLISLTL